MPMRYADQDDVLAELEIDSGETATVDRVVTVENALADLFDAEIGTSFGTTATAETREVIVERASPRLIASVGIRAVTGIETGGTWDGATWVDSDAVDAADYRLTHRDHDGLYWAIDHLAGRWSGVVRVTATWADQSVLAVPDDVQQAMTFLTIRRWRRLTSSPGEVVGPDGFQVVTPDGWKDATVQRAIANHRIVRMVV